MAALSRFFCILLLALLTLGATTAPAFAQLQPGASMVLIAPHNPLPLLSQLEQIGSVGVEYLVEGPDEWHLKLTKQA